VFGGVYACRAAFGVGSGDPFLPLSCETFCSLAPAYLRVRHPGNRVVVIDLDSEEVLFFTGAGCVICVGVGGRVDVNSGSLGCVCAGLVMVGPAHVFVHVPVSDPETVAVRAVAATVIAVRKVRAPLGQMNLRN
jgi:hypothetical protein